MRVGDRVGWTGLIDFGRREVRWIGTVLTTSAGVVSGVRLDGDVWRETGPRHPAAMVLSDVPQHGETEHLPGTGETTGDIAYAIRMDHLELVEACSDDRHRELTDLVTLHQRRAAVCACSTCRPKRGGK